MKFLGFSLFLFFGIVAFAALLVAGVIKIVTQALKDAVSIFKGDKKSKNKILKAIEIKKETEIKEKTKELFNYEIPIVQVEKAGITTTGAKCENELEKVASEFKNYRNLKGLWTFNKQDISYKLNGEKLIRITNRVEEVIDG